MSEPAYKEERNKIIEIGRVNGFKRNAIVRLLRRHKQRAGLRRITTLQPEEKATHDWKILVFDVEKGLKKILADLGMRMTSNSNQFKVRCHLRMTKLMQWTN